MAPGEADTSTSMDGHTISILFVCHANMCRSPLAEGVFLHHAAARGVESRVLVDSAGTWASDGVAPHRGSVDVARTFGVELERLCGTSRRITPDDLERFEHIIVMDRANLADVARLRRSSAFGPVEGAQARVRLLREVADPSVAGPDADVPDPVAGGRAHFRKVYAIIEEGCLALLRELTQPRL